MKVISRKEAKEKGLKRYFTGKPCNKEGHISERYVSNSHCTECEYFRVRKKSKEGYFKEYNKRTGFEKKRCQSLKRKAWKRKWNKSEKGTEYRRKYEKANKAMMRHKAMKKYTRTKQAMPSWVDEYYIEEIKAIYEEARRMELETGTKYEVDHIIPIQGEVVSGLHVPWNLQILTAFDNTSKSNKLL